MTEHFGIAERHLPDAAHLTLRGELDLDARQPLREALRRAVAARPRVVVDLAAVEFLDSEALSALIEGYNEARERGVGYQLLAARGTVRRVLEITGAIVLEQG